MEAAAQQPPWLLDAAHDAASSGGAVSTLGSFMSVVPSAFALADGGTLFLDEVGELPLEHGAVTPSVARTPLNEIGGDPHAVSGDG